MEQLVERVSAALAAEYPGAPNGRVREVPDRRSIRWYTTIGLVDRPLGTRGRTVLYGPRHLLQLVAIKRRQAAGRTLAEIQEELAGASEQTLAEVARVPTAMLGTDQPPAAALPARPAFWKAAPDTPLPLPLGAGTVASADVSPEPGADRPGIETAAPAADPPAADPPAADLPVPAAVTETSIAKASVTNSPAAALSSSSPGPEADGRVRRELATAVEALGQPSPPTLPLITGVPLGGGVVLLLPRHTTDLDRDDIAVAARPLLALLASRGLTDGRVP